MAKILKKINNLASKKNNILKFAGILSSNNKEWKNIEKKLEKDRKNANLREVKL